MKKTLVFLLSLRNDGTLKEVDYKFIKNIISTLFESVKMLANNANLIIFLSKLEPGHSVDKKVREESINALADLKSKVTYSVGLTMSQFGIKAKDSDVMNDYFIEDLEAIQIKIDEKKVEIQGEK